METRIMEEVEEEEEDKETKLQEFGRSKEKTKREMVVPSKRHRQVLVPVCIGISSVPSRWQRISEAEYEQEKLETGRDGGGEGGGGRGGEEEEVSSETTVNGIPWNFAVSHVYPRFPHLNRSF
ncbi:hypothetical protein V1477_020985 [Vespula maculifrons]|uniref:Uncharacterized protein n=1 Tax=Vespula maculifrons TaxID=7453 RepID=A0ABD2AR87_VESMC